ncbi:MAG: hypothetical protein SPJ13_02040 [Bacteroidales bacterium]|nr:hypothetical protein [Bacteroidales bacterium]
MKKIIILVSVLCLGIGAALAQKPEQAVSVEQVIVDPVGKTAETDVKTCKAEKASDKACCKDGKDGKACCKGDKACSKNSKDGKACCKGDKGDTKAEKSCAHSQKHENCPHKETSKK